jgi:DNA-binding MarR family transcriptional regulator
MAELVLYLEAHGYVSREPDPHDGPAKLVLPTERGWEVVAIAQDLVPQLADRITAVLDPEHTSWRQFLRTQASACWPWTPSTSTARSP